jgi:hypothetical protein
MGIDGLGGPHGIKEAKFLFSALQARVTCGIISTFMFHHCGSRLALPQRANYAIALPSKFSIHHANIQKENVHV